MQLLLASANAHKFREFKNFFVKYDIFTGSGVELLLPDADFLMRDGIAAPGEIEETGETYEANALIKARSWANCSGFPAIADDSGLEVHALSWAPGVRSARVVDGSDEDRVRWLLRELKGAGNRRACFVANLVIAFPGDEDSAEKGRNYFSVEGRCWGRIADSPSGNNGFGYDPVFIPDGFVQTFGELSHEEKSNISHRAIAMRGIAKILPAVLKYKTVRQL